MTERARALAARRTRPEEEEPAAMPVDERPNDLGSPRAEQPRADDEVDGPPVERTVGTVLEGVDRVAAKIKGLLGTGR